MPADLKLIHGGPDASVDTSEKSEADSRDILSERLLNLGVEDALLMDGFDGCAVGVLERFGMPRVVLYDKDLVLQKLMDEGIDSYEAADEFYQFNQLGGWHGETTPGFLVWLPEL